jgi:catechol 2,3-dioxygenase-like lactoylglutathione lyase family enzyme
MRFADRTFVPMIPAKDIARTRRFYEDILGLEVAVEIPAAIMYRAGDGFLGLYPTELAGTAQHTLGAFFVEDLDPAVEQLRGKGVEFEEYDFPGLKTENGIAQLEGERSAWFRDPEGNVIAVSEFS